MISMGKKYLTRDGRRVRILCTDRKGCDDCVIALVHTSSIEECYTYYPNGRFHLSGIDGKDLIEIEIKDETT